MAAALKLRCQTKGGLKALDGLNPASTVADLLLAISTATAIPSSRLKVKVGFPPKALDVTDMERSLSDLQVRSGDKITVDEDQDVSPSSGPEPASGPAVSDRLLQEQLAMDMKGILQRKVIGEN
jgi:hypothetical protein